MKRQKRKRPMSVQCVREFRVWLNAEIENMLNVHVYADYIEFGFKTLPNVVFIGCYLPPSDSLYFTLDNLARINAHIKDDKKALITMGGLNCRFSPVEADFLSD